MKKIEVEDIILVDNKLYSVEDLIEESCVYKGNWKSEEHRKIGIFIESGTYIVKDLNDKHIYRLSEYSLKKTTVVARRGPNKPKNPKFPHICLKCDFPCFVCRRGKITCTNKKCKPNEE